jgi:hypothetical protein
VGSVVRASLLASALVACGDPPHVEAPAPAPAPEPTVVVVPPTDVHPLQSWTERLTEQQQRAAVDPTYQPWMDEAGPVLPRPGDHATVGVAFTRRGAQISNRPLTDEQDVELAATAIVRGDARQALNDGEPQITGASVSTARGHGVTEWWRSLESGYEHGFTLEARPLAEASGSLEIEIAIGRLHAIASTNGAVLHDAHDRRIADYGMLVAWDASHRQLPVTMSVRGERVVLGIDDADATYPVIVDPMLGYFFEGTTQVYDNVAAISNISGGTAAAGFYVSTRSGTTWTQSASPMRCQAGSSVATSVGISSDGRYIFAGCDCPTCTAVQPGLMFQRSNLTTPAAMITGPGWTIAQRYGQTVALSENATTLFMGGADCSIAVFTGTPPATYTYQTTFSAGSGCTNGFRRLQFSNGRLLASPPNSGTRIYSGSGASWTLEATLDNGMGDISGSWAVVSSSGANGLTFYNGPPTWASVANYASNTSWWPGLGGTLGASGGGTYILSGTAVTQDLPSASLDTQTTDVAPDGSAIIAGGNIYRVGTASAQGAACGNSIECASGMCVDGFCCNSACGSTCDACSMARTGQANGTCAPLSTTVAPTVQCHTSTGMCDAIAYCTPTSTACPDTHAMAGTVCRAASTTDACDAPEVCTGSSDMCPTADARQAMGFDCRPSAGPCDIAEYCPGGTAPCPTDTFLPSGASCAGGSTGSCATGVCNGSSAMCVGSLQPAGHVCLARDPSNPCDVDDTCNGTDDVCRAAFASASTACVAAAMSGACDAPDHCSGTGLNCVDVVQPSMTPCRAAVAGGCDVAEACDGTSHVCPADAVLPAGVICRLQNGVCDVQEVCDGTTNMCPPDARQPSTFECRASAGACDPAEQCDGFGVSCPPNTLLGAGAACGSAGTACVTGGSCSGSSPTCQGGTFRPINTVCHLHDPSNPCELDSVCDGVDDVCNARFAPASTPCGPAVNGVCDAPDHCSGTSLTCMAVFLTGVECRASAGACDVAESCSGTSANCPPDAHEGASTVCRASTASCDPAESCDGTNASCPADVNTCSTMSDGGVGHDAGAGSDGALGDAGAAADGGDAAAAHDASAGDATSSAMDASGTPPPATGSCGCRVARAPTPIGLFGLGLVALVVRKRRRR